MSTAHPITLTAADQATLRAVLRRGTTAPRVITRARILLKLADAWTDPAIASALDVSRSTVGRIRTRFLEGGLAAVLHDRPRPGQPPVLTPAQGAHLSALACTPAPDGHDQRPLDAAPAGRQSGRTGLRGAHRARDHPPVA
jgi:hypothetical protein